MAEFKFINLWQTNEERRDKYILCLALGAQTWQARRMRDWRITKIERLYQLLKTNQKLPVSKRISLLTEQMKLRLQFNTAS